MPSAALYLMNTKKHLIVPLILIAVGGIYLYVALKPVFNGEALKFSPAMAVAIGTFLAAIVAFVVNRSQSGPSGPPNP